MSFNELESSTCLGNITVSLEKWGPMNVSSCTPELAVIVTLALDSFIVLNSLHSGVAGDLYS